MSYAHRLPYAAAKAPWRVYNRGCVYVQPICETYREISLFVFILARFCVECFLVCLWISHATGRIPGDAAADGVERPGLYSNADPYAVAHTDDYTYFDGNTNPDTLANIDGHAIADTDIDAQPATIAYRNAADINAC
jgi:hypothetical protein